MLSGKYIDYLTCAKVLDSLKGDKTVGARGWGGFGEFTNEHALRWKEIVDDYARGNIYLAEIAQMVQQAALYDIPNAKKRLARLQTVRLRVISDCHFRKKGTEYDRKPGIKWLSCTEKCQSDILVTLSGAAPQSVKARRPHAACAPPPPGVPPRPAPPRRWCLRPRRRRTSAGTRRSSTS